MLLSMVFGDTERPGETSMHLKDRTWTTSLRLLIPILWLVTGSAEAVEFGFGATRVPVEGRRFLVLQEFQGEAVLDRDTQLVWERSPSPKESMWVNAGARCSLKTVGGHKGWRLPSFIELMTLVDPSVQGTPLSPTLPDGHPFLGVAAESFWSVTAQSDNPTYAYTVDFQLGDLASRRKHNLGRYWCVRGGIPDSAEAPQPILHPEVL